MSFTISTREATAGDKSGIVYALGDDTGRIEVWPFLGFNCLRWQVRNRDGSWGNLLYTADDWETNPVPTRSGHPVLFPFPNRIARGRFQFEGKVYQLPLNEATGKHAIHGFTSRNAWRVTATTATHHEATITGEFHLSRDLPASASLWPADFILQLTYRLSADSLNVLAVIENPDNRSLPFGLGYHPYFCLPNGPGLLADEMVLHSCARQLWETEELIPTGRRLPVPSDLDFRTTRPVGPAELDRLFLDLGESPVAWLGHPSGVGKLSIEVSPQFRELLLFTPPHRKAVAIEPYTCATDAANLAGRGIDAGWNVLVSGARFSETVQYRWKCEN